MPPTDETVIGCLDFTPRPLNVLAEMLLQDRAADVRARAALARHLTRLTAVGELVASIDPVSGLTVWSLA